MARPQSNCGPICSEIGCQVYLLGMRADGSLPHVQLKATRIVHGVFGVYHDSQVALGICQFNQQVKVSAHEPNGPSTQNRDSQLRGTSITGKAKHGKALAQSRFKCPAKTFQVHGIISKNWNPFLVRWFLFSLANNFKQPCVSAGSVFGICQK